MLVTLFTASMFLFPRLVFAEETLLPIQISEVLPNPVGDDTQLEWIELYNPTENDVSLDGWSISDAYGATKTYAFAGKTIATHSFYVVERIESGITLNNDQEQIVLRSPVGQLASTAIMTNIPEGKSFSFIDGGWVWTDPTKGIANSTVLPSPSLSPSTLPSPTPSQQPTPTLQPSPSPTPITLVVGNIVLSEVQACSSKEHEWIELQNIGDTEAALDDWKLLDAGSVIASNLENIHIPPHGFAVIELDSYHLNNGGDLIQLQYGTQNKDQFAYDYCEQGKTWAKLEDGYWRNTSCATKGATNISCEESSITNSPSPTPLQPTGQQSQQVNVYSPSPRPSATTRLSQQVRSATSSSVVQYILPKFEDAIDATINGKIEQSTNLGKVLSATDVEQTDDLKSSLYIVGGLLLSVSSAYPAFKETRRIFRRKIRKSS